MNLGQFIHPFHQCLWAGGGEEQQSGLWVQIEEWFSSSVSILNCVLFKEVMVSRLSNQFHQTNPTVSTPQDPTSERERGEECSRLKVLSCSLKACQRWRHARTFKPSFFYGHFRAYANNGKMSFSKLLRIHTIYEPPTPPQWCAVRRRVLLWFVFVSGIRLSSPLSVQEVKPSQNRCNFSHI